MPKKGVCGHCGDEFASKFKRKHCDDCVSREVWKIGNTNAGPRRPKKRKPWLVRQPQPVIGTSPGRWVSGPCKVCQKNFVGQDKRHVFCSIECRDIVYPNIKAVDASYSRTSARRKASGKRRQRDSHRARARRYGVEYEFVNPRKVYDRDKWMCFCGGHVDKTLKYPDPLSVSLDHIVPMSCGGGNTYANTQCSHLKCNVEKGNSGGIVQQLALIG